MSCFSCFKKTNQVYPIVVINDGKLMQIGRPGDFFWGGGGGG